MDRGSTGHRQLDCLGPGVPAWGSARLAALALIRTPDRPSILALQALPYYLFGLLLMWVFVFRLRLLPLMGGYTAGTFPGPRLDFAADLVYHAILPGASIVLVAMGSWGLLTRALVVTSLGEDSMLFA